MFKAALSPCSFLYLPKGAYYVIPSLEGFRSNFAQIFTNLNDVQSTCFGRFTLRSNFKGHMTYLCPLCYSSTTCWNIHDIYSLVQYSSPLLHYTQFLLSSIL